MTGPRSSFLAFIGDGAAAGSLLLDRSSFDVTRNVAPDVHVFAQGRTPARGAGPRPRTPPSTRPRIRPRTRRARPSRSAFAFGFQGAADREGRDGRGGWGGGVSRCRRAGP